jgi:DNA-binding NarL/FixJ family response regulator
MSMYAEDQYARRVLKAGASGYLTKETAPDELLAAIRKIVRGGKYISASLAERLAMEIGGNPDQAPHEALSDREFQVMRLLGQGKTVSQIAAELSLSVKTVSTYRHRVLVKLNLKTNGEVIHYTLQHKLVEGAG